MLRFAIDEDFDHDIVRALLRRTSDVDILTIQEAGHRGLPDPEVLAWAAGEERILLTHDAKTMVGHAYARVGRGLPMPGVIVVPQALPIREAIEALLLLNGASVEGEWEGQVIRLPI